MTRVCCRLQDVSGGDEARFALLATFQDLKLVGRLGPSLEEMQALQGLRKKHEAAQLEQQKLHDLSHHRHGVIHERQRGFDSIGFFKCDYCCESMNCCLF